MWRWRQRLDLYCHKPRNTKVQQSPSEARKSQEIILPQKTVDGTWHCQHFDSGHLAFWTERINFHCLKPLALLLCYRVPMNWYNIYKWMVFLIHHHFTRSENAGVNHVILQYHHSSIFIKMVRKHLVLGGNDDGDLLSFVVSNTHSVLNTPEILPINADGWPASGSLHGKWGH